MEGEERKKTFTSRAKRFGSRSGTNNGSGNNGKTSNAGNNTASGGAFLSAFLEFAQLVFGAIEQFSRPKPPYQRRSPTESAGGGYVLPPPRATYL